MAYGYLPVYLPATDVKKIINDKKNIEVKEFIDVPFKENLDSKKIDDTASSIEKLIDKLNEKSLADTISNLTNILVSLDILVDAAGAAASAVASVFDAAASIDVGLSSDLERMQAALGEFGTAAYEKFQNPMRSAVNEVTSYVNLLSRSITDGELSESFEKMATGMSYLASSVITLTAESVLPAAINSLGWIMDHGVAVITVVSGIAATFAAYKIAVEGAAIATAALKNLDPTLLAFSAFAGAAAAAVLVVKSTSEEASFTAETLTDKIQSETDAIKEQRKALEDLKKAQEEKIAADIAEADNIERLWGELQGCLDEATGEIISNNDRANAIISLLNNNYGMNIECIGNQIQGYNELADSMDGYLDKLRLESRIRNGQAVYDEAVAQYDELIKKRDELMTREENAKKLWDTQANAGEYEAANLTGNVRANIQVELAEIDAAIADCESEMAEYEDLFSKKDPYAGMSTAQANAEEYAKKVRQSYETVEEAVADVTYTLGNNPTLQNTIDNTFSYDTSAAEDTAAKVTENIEKATEDTADDVKDTMQNMWDTISRQERLGLISSEEAYKRQLALIQEYCPEYSDEWYSYYQTILDYQRDALREQVQGVRDNISDIVSEYQNSFSELENSVNSYKNKLLSVGSIFTVETETDDQGNESKSYKIADMTEQMEKMKKYHELVKNLKDRGVSSEVLSELTAMDMDEGMAFAENLAMSSDAELEKISALYAERDKLAEDLANELYAPEMDMLNQKLIGDITIQFGTLPEEIRAIGGQSLAAFIEGILNDKASLSNAAQDFMDSFFTACDEGISSGSIGMKNVGQNIADALGEQDTYAVGLEMGMELLDGFNDALSVLNDQLMSGQAEVAASLAAVWQNAQGSYGGSSWSGSNKTEKIVLENKDEVTVKIDKEVLGKAMREYTREYERRTNT